MTALFVRHLPEIYLAYGFAFLTLAAVVLLQPRGYETKIERPLGWLGWFGFLHGLNELLDWAALAYPDQAVVLRPVRMVVLVASYVPLLEFGRRLAMDASWWPSWLRAGVLWAVVAAGIFVSAFTAPELWSGLGLGARIFMGAPGAALAALALLRLARESASEAKGGYPTAMLAGAAFAVYAVAGVITTSGAHPLWSWLPGQDWFLATFGFPIQLLRAACALSVAAGVSLLLRNLNARVRERERKLATELAGLNASLEARVEARTRDLHVANLELGRRIEVHLRTLEELTRSEALMRAVFDQGAAGVTFLDEEGHYQRVNDCFARMLGRPAAEIVGRHLSVFTHPDDHAEDRRCWEALRTQRVSFYTREKRYCAPDGTVRWCTVTVTAAKGTIHETRYLGITLDTTERRQVEAAHQASEARLHLALMGARHGMFEFDLETQHVRVTPAPGDDEASMSFEGSHKQWLERLHPEDQARVKSRALDLSSPSPSQTRYTLEFRRAGSDGGWRWILASGGVMVDPISGHRLLIGTHVDITDQREFERRMLRTQRLESIGQLASGIAHDLNNALLPLTTGFSLIRPGLHGDDLAVLAAMEQSTRRVVEMGRQLLAFARGAEGRRLAVHPAEILDEMQRFVTATFPRSIRLRIVCAKEDVRSGAGVAQCLGTCEQCRHRAAGVQGDPTQLHQVLLNLCINARDAMPHGGDLTLQLAEVAVDADHAARQPGAVPGLYVRFSVADTGTGIPPQLIDRIFDPFFTTKGPDKGTGLGLSTVLGIVKGHGGFITVRSEENRGSQFEVYLPMVPLANAANPESAPR